MTDISEWQKRLYTQYLDEEKHLIFIPHGVVGDVAELGLLCEEIGEVINSIRRKKGIEDFKLECADVLARMFNFMSRKHIDIESAVALAYAKNLKRKRKGLFIEEKKGLFEK